MQDRQSRLTWKMGMRAVCSFAFTRFGCPSRFCAPEPPEGGTPNGSAAPLKMARQKPFILVETCRGFRHLFTHSMTKQFLMICGFGLLAVTGLAQDKPAADQNVLKDD